MHHNRRHFMKLLAVVPWLLSGCGPTTIKDTATQTYVPIQGWMLELHRDVTIPPGRTRVFFQDGRLSHGINEYKPHCQLRVWEISEHPQSVRSDRFSIEKVFGSFDQIVSNGQLRFVAAAAVVMGGGGDGDGMGQLMHLYHMELHADTQPNVTYLVCGGKLDDPAFAKYPTIQDIRTSMGDYATLIIPE